MRRLIFFRRISPCSCFLFHFASLGLSCLPSPDDVTVDPSPCNQLSCPPAPRTFFSWGHLQRSCGKLLYWCGCAVQGVFVMMISAAPTSPSTPILARILMCQLLRALRTDHAIDCRLPEEEYQGICWRQLGLVPASRGWLVRCRNIVHLSLGRSRKFIKRPKPVSPGDYFKQRRPLVTNSFFVRVRHKGLCRTMHEVATSPLFSQG